MHKIGYQNESVYVLQLLKYTCEGSNMCYETKIDMLKLLCVIPLKNQKDKIKRNNFNFFKVYNIEGIDKVIVMKIKVMQAIINNF